MIDVNPFSTNKLHAVPAVPVREPVLNVEAARKAFEIVFALRVPSFEKSKNGVYTNDRTEGKFQGFYAAVAALEKGDIHFGDMRV